jgi:hypothetical protein
MATIKPKIFFVNILSTYILGETTRLCTPKNMKRISRAEAEAVNIGWRIRDSQNVICKIDFYLMKKF